MQVEGVWFRYGRRGDWILRAVDAALQPGDTVVVLGRNGAGKSTLLQLVAGVLSPVRGTIRRRPPIVGWVPERFPTEQPFTAGQYLARMAAVRGLDGAAIARAVAGEAERLGLGPHLHTRLADLSKGTAQKVGLAQALLVPPDLLILDEPWEGLDASARTLVPQIVAQVTTAGGMVVVSDHRGEVAGLPAAVHWSVTAGTVSTVPEPATAATEAPTDDLIVEVAVRRAEAAETVQRLRAAGHRVLGVRSGVPASAAGSDVPGGQS